MCDCQLSQNFFQFVEISTENKDPDITTIILNNIHLYKEAVELQKVSIVSEALDALQSDSATVALVTDTWNKLLETEMFAPHEDVINSRMEEAIEPFYVGNLMDPNNNGVKSQFRARRSSRKMYQRTKASLSAILSSIQDMNSDIVPSSIFAIRALITYKQSIQMVDAYGVQNSKEMYTSKGVLSIFKGLVKLSS